MGVYLEREGVRLHAAEGVVREEPPRRVRGLLVVAHRQLERNAVVSQLEARHHPRCGAVP